MKALPTARKTLPELYSRRHECCGCTAVSYTHLDVYKRQRLHVVGARRAREGARRGVDGRGDGLLPRAAFRAQTGGDAGRMSARPPSTREERKQP